MPVRPRRPKGPPLNSLRAFEAAARLESFVAAADELCVTAGAISQHIKSIEGWAGFALFHRNAQGVSLSPEGRALVAEFSEAFDALAAAVQSLRALSPQPDIHIAALPSVAQLWLPPRLGAIRAALPDVNISVTAMESPPRLSRELFDISLFISEPSNDRTQIVLAEDVIFPVCAPQLSDAGSVDTLTRLHDQTWDGDWALWTKSAGITLKDPEVGPRYSLYGLAVEEAKSGAGALMGHECLIEQALDAGQLSRMSPHDCKTGKALVLDIPEGARRRPEIDEIVMLLRASV